MSQEVTVKVVLHGSLKELSRLPIELSGVNAAEIINGLKRMLPGFAPSAVNPRPVKVAGFDTEESFYVPLQEGTVMHICPAVSGGGGGGFLKIILGSVLIAAAFAMPTLAPGLASFTFIEGGATIASMTMTMGISFVLGGVLSILSPAPSLGNSSEKETASRYIGSSQNTTKVGTRIPLMYGYNRVYGHYLSVNVDAVDVAV